NKEHFELLDQIPKRHFTDWLQLAENQEETISSIKNFVQKRKGSWDKIIALGIGGSALGILTLKQAFFPFDERLVVIDNLDSNTLQHHLSVLNPERTLVLVISKSGGTLETMTAYEVFKEHFNPEQYQKNFIAITDPQEGKLRERVSRDLLTNFPIPTMVGGRFSVLSPVGLLPLALLGGNIDQLLAGAREMKQRCFEKSPDNPALQLALSTYQLSKLTTDPSFRSSERAKEDNRQPITTLSLFTYSDQLYSLGLWYQQLLAESIGKSREVGLTPLALRGASDQHSVLQLLQDGPNDKLNIFLDIVKPTKDVNIPKPSTLNPELSTIHEILRLECHGTEQALREDDRPTIIIEIPEISEYNLGELFMLFQMQIAILGELYGIDAFNQPGVEKSKKIVNKALES
ncbi:MAG: hypothetical protein U1C97_01745, partial [Candidatus Gracilibacteria bacterium]|nr:hypothetical protein [Candidatus Gracilibacteria bacterium]